MKFLLTYSDNFDVSVYKDLFQDIKIECNHCGKSYRLQDTVLDEFISEYLYTCPYCGVVERVGEYHYTEY